ncbi:MAG: hypothetical protein ABIQ18_05505 [Umezawaea sp.]
MTADVSSSEAPSTESATTPTSAVDALIADALAEMGTPKLSIRELERRSEMNEGWLSVPLKPSNRGRWPSLVTIQRFSQALGRDVTTVSRAFAADSIGEPDSLTLRQRRMVDLLARLPEPYQDAALHQVAALVDLARGVGQPPLDTSAEQT